MGAGKLRGLGIAAAGAAALAVLTVFAGGCSSATLPSSLVPGQTAPPLTPTMTPSAVPVLGQLTLGPFPTTKHGEDALQLCEYWAGLRGQYVARVTAGDTAFQLEQWFSSAAWQPAFVANGPLQTDPSYDEISIAFGLATTGQTAAIAQAKGLDAACAAAD
jgi:hypothetical protein